MTILEKISDDISTFLLVIGIIFLIWSVITGIWSVRLARKGKISGVILSIFNYVGFILSVVCVVLYFHAINKNAREKDELEKKHLKLKIQELEEKVTGKKINSSKEEEKNNN